MAVDDEIILEFQGEDSSFSKTTQKALEEINALDSSIQKLISKFNIFSEVSEKAGNSLSNISKASSGIEEMSNHLEKMSKGFESSSTVMEQTKGAMQSLSSGSSTIDKVSSSTSNLDNQVKLLQQQYEELKQRNDSLERSNHSLAASYNKISATVGLVYKNLKSWTLSAAEATRTQIRFNASFNTTEGELKDMTKWVNEYSNALFLDNIQVEEAISKFRVLTGTMGFNNDKSKQMSQNLTQLAYDLSAISGKDVSETVNQLTSALGGQNKALKDYGISIESAALQETLARHGIDRKVESLSAAERAEVRYQTILEKTADYQGYYAKTMLSPANAANIVKTQFSMLAREIGNVFIPILMTLVPIVIKVTSALRTLAQAIASFFGLKIDFTSYSDGFSLIGGGIDGVGDSADGTSKKVKNMLRDFDDLHVVDFGNDPSGGGGSGAGGGFGSDLFDPMEYADYGDLLGDLQQKFKDLIPIIEGIGIALGAWALSKLFVGDLMKSMKLLDKISVLAGAILISVGAMEILHGLEENDLKKKLIGVLSIGAGAGIMFHSWKAGVLGISIAAALTITLSSIDWIVENWDKSKEKLFGDKEKLSFMENWDVANYSWWTGLMEEVGKLNGISPEDWEKGWDEYWGTAQKSYGKWLNETGRDLDEFETKWTTTTAILTDSSSWKQYWEDVKTGAGQWKDDTVGIFEAFKTVTGRHIGEAVETLKGKFEEMKTNAITKVEEMKNSAIEKWNIFKENLRTKAEEIKTNITNKFTEIKTNISNKIDEVKTNVTSKFESIKTTITDKINGAKDKVKEAIDKIKSFFNFSWKLPDIKLPHFGIDWDVSGAIGQAFQKIGLPGLPSIRVDWYAQGGFPDKGDLFIANEREPELIGSMGNKSAVANSTQIIEGIAQGSYNAFKKALNEMQEDFGGDTYVYVGDTQLTDIVTKRKRIQDKRFGR